MTKARDLANAGTALTSVSATELGYLDGVTSAVQTQLNQKPEFTAGKNKIINGDFAINQRGFTSTTTINTFVFDRWITNCVGGTVTYSNQTFTSGTAPVTGYEGANYLQTVVSGHSATNDLAEIAQRIEDVRTFAGQTVTVSFWAKADASKNVAFRLTQNFGTGGSTSAHTLSSLIPITTSWARYSTTVTLPSMSGKTIGTNSFLAFGLFFSQGSANVPATGLGPQSGTFDVWGFQVEAGSVATPFQTATGTLQGELAACQRYYYRTFPAFTSAQFGPAMAATTTQAVHMNRFPVTMRVRPTALEQSGTAGDYQVVFTTTTTTCSAVPTYGVATTQNDYIVNLTVASGLTAGQAGRSITDATNGANAYLGWSAEL